MKELIFILKSKKYIHVLGSFFYFNCGKNDICKKDNDLDFEKNNKF